MDGRNLRVKFGIERSGAFATPIDHVHDVDTVELDNAIYKGSSNWIESITIGGGNGDAIREELTDVGDIDVVEFRKISPESETYHLIGFAREQNPFILTSLAKTDAIPYRLVAENNRMTIIAVVRDWNHLKDLATSIEDEFEAFELLETSPTEGAGYPMGLDLMKRVLGGKLTDSQLELLETAYRMGYFEVPQEATSEEVATELDISQPAFSEQLRRTESRMFGLVFGESLEQ
jgi:predicted DNA binding protein